MTYYNYNEDEDIQQQKQIIRCPNCKKSVTIDELYEYVNAHPENKKEAIEQEIEMWGITPYYDRQYYVQNVVFCPSCAGISHLSDW
jgi:hypothetical protein